MKRKYLVIYARVFTNSIEYFSDLEFFTTLNAAIRHGFKLVNSDDFNIGIVVGKRLVQLNWMQEKLREPRHTLDKIAEQVGL